MVVKPLDGQVVRSSRVHEVASPAYDALTSTQRRQYRVDHPLCYLHVTRSAPDEDDADTVDNTTLVRRGRAALEQLIDADVFASRREPAWLIYELETSTHRQRGVVGEVPADQFRRWAKPHEATQPERAALLAEHFSTVRAASSPVACTVADGDGLAGALADLSGAELLVEHRSADGLTQRVLRVVDAEVAAAVDAALVERALYIIDGHHRAAASGQLLDRGINLPLLVAVFPPTSLQLVGFHRLVKLPVDLDDAELLRRISRRFRVSPLDAPIPPSRGSVVMLLDDRWHRVEFDERPIGGGPLVRLGSLDPCIVEREIIRALIERDGPVDVAYMPDEATIESVAAEAAAQGRVLILVPPLEVDDVVEVAAGGLIMPAKSTYFTPKVRSGLFLRRYDDEVAAATADAGA